MKKFLLSAVALAVIATPAMAQPGWDNNRHHGPSYGNDHGRPGQGYRHWRKGERFDRRYATNYRVIDNYRSYRLAPPPRGYHYVRSGNDAVLVGITTGIIAGVIAGSIH
jgi:Ni/Co efflux regulator RcnB